MPPSPAPSSPWATSCASPSPPRAWRPPPRPISSPASAAMSCRATISAGRCRRRSWPNACRAADAAATTLSGSRFGDRRILTGLPYAGGDPMSQLNSPVALVGAPTDIGAGHRGAGMGPEALRVAGLAEALRERGLQVLDTGNLSGPANPWQPPVDG